MSEKQKRAGDLPLWTGSTLGKDYALSNLFENKSGFKKKSQQELLESTQVIIFGLIVISPINRVT